MPAIHEILEEINLENGSNYKVSVLKKYSDNDLLKKVLKMTYDRVAYTYGFSMKQIEKFEPVFVDLPISLEFALASLEANFASRLITGNEAKQIMANTLAAMSKEDADVIRKVINRDLRINTGKTQINKVFKGLITKPIYKRCDTYSKKTAKNITFPAMIQLKADGTYREFNVDGDIVTSQSRSGEKYDYPLIFDEMKSYEDGFYMGELTVRCSDKIIEMIKEKIEMYKRKGDNTEKLEAVVNTYQEHQEQDKEYILPREIGNGLINSDDVPHENLVLDLWEYVTPEEYNTAGLKDKKNPCTITYKESFEQLKGIVSNSSNIRVIEHHVVNSLDEARRYVSLWQQLGFEGGVLKDLSMVFKDGTSKHQLKLKLKMSGEFRITGFTEGSGKNADYFGAITFENDEGTIKGKVGVSSMTEAQRDWFHEHREEVIGKIIEVEFNDITKGEGHDYYSLSHPRFIEIRNDKNETDTLEKIFKIRQMALELE